MPVSTGSLFLNHLLKLQFMKINFEKEFSTWLKKQPLEYIEATSTENILIKFISGNFLGNHYGEMANILVEETKLKYESTKTN